MPSPRCPACFFFLSSALPHMRGGQLAWSAPPAATWPAHLLTCGDSLSIRGPHRVAIICGLTECLGLSSSLETITTQELSLSLFASFWPSLPIVHVESFRPPRSYAHLHRTMKHSSWHSRVCKYVQYRHAAPQHANLQHCNGSHKFHLQSAVSEHRMIGRTTATRWRFASIS